MNANFKWAKLRDKETYDAAGSSWNDTRKTTNADMREKLHSFKGPKLHALGDYEERSASGSSPKGLEQLYSIIVDMRRDIKKVAQGNCLPSAKEYATKLSKRTGVKHEAYRQDLNGDGIDEIVVRDVYGNPCVINGYTTIKSKWPERLQFHSTRQHSATRTKANGDPAMESLQEWRHREFNPTYGTGSDILNLTSYAEPEWTKAAIKAGYKNTPHKPKNGKRSAYKALQEAFLKPVWDELTADHLHSIKRKNYLSACAFVWNFLFVSRAMYDVYGEEGLEWHLHICQASDVPTSEMKAYNKAKNDSELKSRLERLVIGVASAQRDQPRRVSFNNMFRRLLRLGSRFADTRDTSAFNEASVTDHVTTFDKVLNGTQTVEPETPEEIAQIMGSAVSLDEGTEVQLDEEESDGA